MKQSEILKRLKAISELIGNNIVSAWNEDLSNPSEAVLLEDITDKNGKEVEAEYNGWNEKLEKLIAELEEHKEPTKMEVMVGEFIKYISVDNATQEEIETEIKKLQLYLCKDETLDHILSDRFSVCSSFEYDFTVESFLEQIDIRGYE